MATSPPRFPSGLRVSLSEPGQQAKHFTEFHNTQLASCLSVLTDNKLDPGVREHHTHDSEGPTLKSSGEQYRKVKSQPVTTQRQKQLCLGPQGLSDPVAQTQACRGSPGPPPSPRPCYADRPQSLFKACPCSSTAISKKIQSRFPHTHTQCCRGHTEPGAQTRDSAVLQGKALTGGAYLSDDRDEHDENDGKQQSLRVPQGGLK